MYVEDEWMERLFRRETPVREILNELWGKLKAGGVDITPLKKLIH